MTWSKQARRWRAQYQDANRQRCNIGYFDTQEGDVWWDPLTLLEYLGVLEARTDPLVDPVLAAHWWGPFLVLSVPMVRGLGDDGLARQARHLLEKKRYNGTYPNARYNNDHLVLETALLVPGAVLATLRLAGGGKPKSGRLGCGFRPPDRLKLFYNKLRRKGHPGRLPWRARPPRLLAYGRRDAFAEPAVEGGGAREQSGFVRRGARGGPRREPGEAPHRSVRRCCRPDPFSAPTQLESSCTHRVAGVNTFRTKATRFWLRNRPQPRR